MSWVLVALGAAAGAMGRYAIDLFMQRWWISNHPSRVAVGILTANVVGSAILGVATARLNDDLMLLVGTGFCGALTTFSSFAGLTEESFREGFPRAAIANIVLNLGLCLGVLSLTFSLAQP